MTHRHTVSQHRLLGLLLSMIFAPWVCVFASTEKPNIILIVAEDMSSRIGAFGDSVARTPSIDALAEAGIRYTNTFTAAGVCAPNRSALITGVYPQSMGTHQMRTSQMGYEAVPPADVKAFPELLRRAGYATANTTKTDYQFGNPFTIWDTNVDTGFSNPEDLALWRHLPRDKPFFAMFNLMNTHESRLVDETTQATQRMPWVKPLLKSVLDFRAANIPAVTDPLEVTVPPYYPDTPAVRRSIAQMYNNIQYIDQQTAEILKNLETDGLADNTIIIWTTDHGDGFPRAKRSIYDSGIKVPMIIRYPDGRLRGTTDERLISFVDLAPTILALAGAPIPQFIQGQSFLDETRRAHIFAGRDRMDETRDWQRAARDRQFKYIRNYMPELSYFRPLAFRDMFPIMVALWEGHRAGTLTPVQDRYFTAPRNVDELYDTLADPFEVKNLAGDPAFKDTLAGLQAAMDDWIAQVGDLSQRPEQAMIDEMWPGGEQPITSRPLIKLEADEVTLASSTPGASIGYRILPTDALDHWSLYQGPVTLAPGQSLQAKAIRYGYRESDITHFDLENQVSWQVIEPGGDAQCSAGTPYRFLARQADSDKLLIYFQGGGGCWRRENCDPEMQPTYRRDPDVIEPLSKGIFEFSHKDNPFRDHSVLYVPYCTADVHLGQNDAVYPAVETDQSPLLIRHRGHMNASTALNWARAHFNNASQIFVTGSSAGAIPSPLYASLIADQYPNANIAQLGDAGGGYRFPQPDTRPRDTWGTFNYLPDLNGFDQIDPSQYSYEKLYIAAAKAHPNVRFARFDTSEDRAQKTFLAYRGVTGSMLPGLLANNDDIRHEVENFSAYVAEGDFHTIMHRDAFYTLETAGVRFRDWVARLAALEPTPFVTCEACIASE